MKQQKRTAFVVELEPTAREGRIMDNEVSFVAHAFDHFPREALSLLTGKRDVEAMLVDVDDIGDGRAERAEDRTQVEHVGLRYANAFRHPASKGRAIAAKGEKGTFLRLPSNASHDLPHSICHQLKSSAGDIERGLLDALTKRLRYVLFDHVACAFCIESARTAQEIIGGEPLQREKGIGQGRLGSTQVVAGRPWIGTHTLRPDP